MKKLILTELPQDPNIHPDISGAVTKTIISRGTVDSLRGYLSIAEFAPGGEHRLHRHTAADQITYLISGRAQHLTKNGPVPVTAGDAIYIPKHEWHGFRNVGAGEAILLSIHSPIAEIINSGYETYTEKLDASETPTALKVSSGKVLADIELDESAGVHGIDVFWLATRKTVGSEDCLLGAATCQPGGLHQQLRHPHADKFFYVTEGEGELATTNSVVRLRAGECAYIPANEFHAFRNQNAGLTKALFGYFGGATPDEAGLEIRGDGR